MLNPVRKKEKRKGIDHLIKEVKLYYNLASLPENMSETIGENINNLKNDLKSSEITAPMLDFEWKPSTLPEVSVNQNIKEMQRIYDKLILNYKAKNLNEDSEVVKFRENFYQLLVYTRTVLFSLHLSSLKKAENCFKKIFSIWDDLFFSQKTILYIQIASCKLYFLNALRYSEFLINKNESPYNIYCDILKIIEYLDAKLDFKITGNLYKKISDKINFIESKDIMAHSEKFYDKFMPNYILDLTLLSDYQKSMADIISVNTKNFLVNNQQTFDNELNIILYENDVSEIELTACLEYIKDYFIANTKVFDNDINNDSFPNSKVYTYLNLKNIASLIKFRFKLFPKYEEKQKKLITQMDNCLKQFKLEDKSSFSDFLNKDRMVEVPFPSLLLGYKKSR